VVPGRELLWGANVLWGNRHHGTLCHRRRGGRYVHRDTPARSGCMSKRCSSCLKLVFNPCLAFDACQTGAYDEILVRHCGLCAAAHSNYLTSLVNGADRVYPPKWLAPSHSYAVDSTPPLYSVCTPCSCTTCLLSPSPQPCTASTLCVSLVTTRSLALVGHHLPPHLRRCRLPALRLPRHPQSC
jgi:hypothetical protein